MCLKTTKQLRNLLLVSSSLLFLSAPALAQSIRVRHDHDPWGGCDGEITISENGIQYLSDKKESHNRHWTWLDIQTVDRRSFDRFTILTYQDQKWLLGRDRPWDFKVLSEPGSEGLSDGLFALIRSRLDRPVVDREARAVTPDYAVPVKHLHSFGGCEGVLRFSSDWVVYVTDHAEDQRSWRRAGEVANIWSAGPYDLEIEVYEKEGGDLLRTRRFRFQLKRPLDPDYYSQLRRQMLPPR